MTRKRWKNPDKRMAWAVDLRRQGWSLRRIAAELAVSVGTVHNDLARWEREQVEALFNLCSISDQLNTPIEQSGGPK